MLAAVRTAALVAAALLLAGCFVSEEELIGYWAADRPIQDGVWAHWPTHPDGTEWEGETWRGALRYDRRRLVSEEADFPHHGARFRELAEGVHIVQWAREDGVGYGVAWLYEGGAVLSYHQPDCAGLPAEARDAVSLGMDAEGFCRLSSLDQLEEVIRAYLDALGGEIRVDGVYRRVG